jgi:hypothetical protein
MNFVLLAIALMASISQSSVVMKTLNRNFGQTAGSCSGEVTIDTSFFRNDMKCGASINFSSIFDAKKNHMIYVDHMKKTFYISTEKDMKQAGEQMSNTMKMLEDQKKKMKEEMRHLPESQKKAMEKMIATQMAGLSGKIKVTKHGAPKKVGKYMCQDYVKSLNGKKISETCIANWSQAKVDYSKYKFVGDALKKYMEKWMMNMPANMAKEEAMTAQLSNGFMVQDKGFQDAKQTRESTLLELSEQTVAPDLISPPSGYTRQNKQ